MLTNGHTSSNRPKLINWLKKMKRRKSFLKTRIIELDPVLNTIVTFLGIRFNKQLDLRPNKTIIWVRNPNMCQSGNVKLIKSFRKDFNVFQ